MATKPKTKRYVVVGKNAIGGAVYLDTTDPDTWTSDKQKAMSSERREWIKRHADRRGLRVETI